MNEPREQTVWISIPGAPGRWLRVRLITEIYDQLGSHQETATAVDAGSVIAGLQQARFMGAASMRFTAPSD